MQDQFAAAYLDILRGRVLDRQGSIAGHNRGGYRPDAAAWAAVALQALGLGADLLPAIRTRLVAQQLPDGRVCLSPEHPETIWLTSLAILAWQGAPEQRQAQLRASRFLLTSTGRHWPRTPDMPFAHDSDLIGWPWIDKTHSWVEPTALAVLALRVNGWGRHGRVKEAVRLLLDRQIPGGGWNYGNTRVFGQELFPFPESTGLALNALKGMVPQARVQKSLDYLNSRLQEVRTPLALGWGLMGLAAWGQEPLKYRAWIKESLDRQKRYGPYDTAALSLLLVATRAPQGLESAFTR